MKCCRPLPSFYICSQKFIELTSPKLKEVDDLASKSRITNVVKRVGHYLGNEAFYNRVVFSIVCIPYDTGQFVL